MGENAEDDRLFWIEPERRGVIPLNGFHLSRSLRKVLKSEVFEVRVNSDFDATIEGCASPDSGRMSTWINGPIRKLYRTLFDQGRCHTVEAWRGNLLVGGLYGVHLGCAFFGESMFSRETDASKIALAHLVARLNYCGFTLLDTQFITPHLRRLGAIEISRNEYRRRLVSALKSETSFLKEPLDLEIQDVLQLVSQTSNTGCSTP